MTVSTSHSAQTGGVSSASRFSSRLSAMVTELPACVITTSGVTHRGTSSFICSQDFCLCCRLWSCKSIGSEIRLHFFTNRDFVFHLFVCLFLLKMKVVGSFCRKYLSVKTQFKPFYWIIRCFLRASLKENDVYFRLFMRPKCELSSLGGRNVNQKKQTK